MENYRHFRLSSVVEKMFKGSSGEPFRQIYISEGSHNEFTNLLKFYEQQQVSCIVSFKGRSCLNLLNFCKRVSDEVGEEIAVDAIYQLSEGI